MFIIPLIVGVLVFFYVFGKLDKSETKGWAWLWAVLGLPISLYLSFWLLAELGLDLGSNSNSNGPHCYETLRGVTCD